MVGESWRDDDVEAVVGRNKTTLTNPQDGTREIAGGYYRAVLNLSRPELSCRVIASRESRIEVRRGHDLDVMRSPTSHFQTAYDHNDGLSSL